MVDYSEQLAKAESYAAGVIGNLSPSREHLGSLAVPYDHLLAGWVAASDSREQGFFDFARERFYDIALRFRDNIAYMSAVAEVEYWLGVSVFWTTDTEWVENRVALLELVHNSPVSHREYLIRGITDVATIESFLSADIDAELAYSTVSGR